MIDIAKLGEKDVGRWVLYNCRDRKIEKGRIKSWNAIYIFVVYHCAHEWDRFQDFTAAATDPNNLVFDDADSMKPLKPKQFERGEADKILKLLVKKIKERDRENMSSKLGRTDLYAESLNQLAKLWELSRVGEE